MNFAATAIVITETTTTSTTAKITGTYFYNLPFQKKKTDFPRSRYILQTFLLYPVCFFKSIFQVLRNNVITYCQVFIYSSVFNSDSFFFCKFQFVTYYTFYYFLKKRHLIYILQIVKSRFFWWPSSVVQPDIAIFQLK